MAAPTQPTRQRLSKDERRTQLLEAAQRLLVERGISALTMERLAEYASVSKALPYNHFENSDEVLVAVTERVVFALGERVLATVAENAQADASTKVAAIIATYFDTVAELGAILQVVTAPGSRAAELADGDKRLGPNFIAELLRVHLGTPAGRARAAAPIVLGALTGAVQGWVAGDASRKQAEALCVEVLETLAADA